MADGWWRCTQAGLALFRTLNAAQIDAVISQTLAREALAAEQARRPVWRQVTERVAEITQ